MVFRKLIFFRKADAIERIDGEWEQNEIPLKEVSGRFEILISVILRCLVIKSFRFTFLAFSAKHAELFYGSDGPV